MQLPPFLLDHWLAAHEFASPPIPFNLASSTGPSWTLHDLLAIDGQSPAALGEIAVGYAPPDGCRELREKIAEFHDVDPDWVVVTTGASEALSILFCLSSRPGGEAILPSPAFPAFAAMARAWGLDVATYALQRQEMFRQSGAEVSAKANSNTVLALVNTPHNPTGSMMARQEIEVLAAELEAPLIVDEVYHPMYFGEAAGSAAGIDNVIVISDMSKALSLAGLRTGWIIDKDAEQRKRIIDARSYFTISSSPILEAIAARALRNRKALLERLEAVTSANLAMLKAFMRHAAGALSWAPPQGGTVAFPWFQDGRNARPFCETLASKGVLLAPGDCFELPDHFRIGFGAQAAGFDRAIEIMSHLLDQQ